MWQSTQGLPVCYVALVPGPRRIYRVSQVSLHSIHAEPDECAEQQLGHEKCHGPGVCGFNGLQQFWEDKIGAASHTYLDIMVNATNGLWHDITLQGSL
jgi:hypothetical protein